MAGRKNIAKLVKKIITDKNGVRRTVLVRDDGWVGNKKSTKTKITPKDVENSYKKYLATSDRLNKQLDDLSRQLNEFPKGKYGVSDEARATDKFKNVKHSFDVTMRVLQDFNKNAPKHFHKRKADDKRASWKTPQTDSKMKSVEDWMNKNKDTVMAYSGSTKKSGVTIGDAFINTKKRFDTDLKWAKKEIDFSTRNGIMEEVNKESRRIDDAIWKNENNKHFDKVTRLKLGKIISDYGKKSMDWITEYNKVISKERKRKTK